MKNQERDWKAAYEQTERLWAANQEDMARVVLAIEADRDRLTQRVKMLEESLKDIVAKSRFEMDNPTGLHMTCLSLIHKAARAALGEKP